MNSRAKPETPIFRRGALVASLAALAALAGCAEPRYGARTVEVALAGDGNYLGGFVPVSMVAFPPGPVTYGMGPDGAITHQQALVIGVRGEVLACRFGGYDPTMPAASTIDSMSRPAMSQPAMSYPGASASDEVVCQRPTGEIVPATRVARVPWSIF